jgi:hypothetical protein
MPQFFQYRDGTTLSEPFRTEQEFTRAGGTPYWRPGFTGTSNVELLNRAAVQPKTPPTPADLVATPRQADVVISDRKKREATIRSRYPNLDPATIAHHAEVGTPLENIGGGTPQPTGQTGGQVDFSAIQRVFGPEWKPSPKFTPELQSRGIYGAVRIDGSPNVYALGPGGGYLSAEAFRNLFGTENQQGIVGQITPAQARLLGIQTVGAGVPGEEIPATRVDTGDYRDVLLKTLEDYLKTAQARPSYQELYERGAKKLGIPGKREAVAGIERQILDTEELLDNLEEDINLRIRGAGALATDPQRRRYLAAEGGPLREQLADLVRAGTRAGAGLAGAREELATMIGLEEKERKRERELGLGLLPQYKELATYESPEEKSKRELAELLREKRALSAEGFLKKPTVSDKDKDYKTLELQSKELTKLNSDRNKLWTRALKGEFGVEGAREKILTEIQRNNPGIDQQKIVDWMYGIPGKVDAAIPDGYEQHLSEATINGFPIQGIIDAYKSKYSKKEIREQIETGEIVVEDRVINLTTKQQQLLLDAL